MTRTKAAEHLRDNGLYIPHALPLHVPIPDTDIGDHEPGEHDSFWGSRALD